MSLPKDLKYAQSHEWVRIDGDIAVIGITDHAQEELGDVALVMLPEVGKVLQADEKFGEIESIKAVSDVYSPVSGVVVEVNEDLLTHPEFVNDEPYDSGWMIKIKIQNDSELSALMSAIEYESFAQES
jgi:glycine cleavage system H protein